MTRGKAYVDGYGDSHGATLFAAEVALVVTPQGDFTEGDHLHPISWSAGKRINADHYCDVSRMDGGAGVPRSFGSIGYRRDETYFDYKVTEISSTESVRVDLATAAAVTLRKEPGWWVQIAPFDRLQEFGETAKAAVIDYVSTVAPTWTVSGTDKQPRVFDGAQELTVAFEYIGSSDLGSMWDYWLRSERHRIFLDDQGRRSLFTGRRRTTHENVETVWNFIEGAGTPPEPDRADIGREYHTRVRWSGSMRRKTLILPVENFTLTREAEISSSKIDETDPENPVALNARNYYINWRTMPEIRDDAQLLADIDDPTIPVDLGSTAVTNEQIRTEQKVA